MQERHYFCSIQDVVMDLKSDSGSIAVDLGQKVLSYLEVTGSRSRVGQECSGTDSRWLQEKVCIHQGK